MQKVGISPVFHDRAVFCHLNIFVLPRLRMSEIFAPSLKSSLYVAQVPEAYGRMDVSSVFCQVDVFGKDSRSRTS
jgi:hypothetical protein